MFSKMLLKEKIAMIDSHTSKNILAYTAFFKSLLSHAYLYLL